MAWWTASGALTALSAHDAAHAGGSGTTAVPFTAIAEDLLGGSNHLGLGGWTTLPSPIVNTYTAPGTYKCWQNINSSSGPNAFKNGGIALPSSGAAVALVYTDLSQNNQPIFSQSTSGATILLYMQNYRLQMGDYYTGGASLGVVGKAWYFFGVYWDASNYQLYFNNALYGSARAFTGGIRPSTIGGKLYTATSLLGDGCAAMGLFSGAGSLSALQAIEAAIRTELASDAIGTGVALPSSLLNRTVSSWWETGVPQGFPGNMWLGKLGMWKYQFSGVTSFSGIVTVESVPAVKRVFLFHKATKILLQDVWSTAGTGAYAFYNLDPALEYFVWAEDNARVWNAVTQDMLVAS